jgi:transposase
MQRHTMGTLCDDALFADLFPQRRQPAQAHWQLALVTLMQFAVNLSDRQAADAVQGRIDWKYIHGLELADQAGQPALFGSDSGYKSIRAR